MHARNVYNECDKSRDKFNNESCAKAYVVTDASITWHRRPLDVSEWTRYRHNIHSTLSHYGYFEVSLLFLLFFFFVPSTAWSMRVTNFLSVFCRPRCRFAIKRFQLIQSSSEFASVRLAFGGRKIFHFEFPKVNHESYSRVETYRQ